ncbi:hypothetical protein D3C72_1836460 [compost metagenome]
MMTHSGPVSCSFFEYTTPLAWSASWNSMMCPPIWCEVTVNWLRRVSSIQRRKCSRPTWSLPTATSSGNRLVQASRSRISSASAYLAGSMRISLIDSSRSSRACIDSMSAVICLSLLIQ